LFIVNLAFAAALIFGSTVVQIVHF